MSGSYGKVTKGLKSEPLKNQAKVKDPIAEITGHRDTVIIDTELELKAVLGDKLDANDTSEELNANRFKL